ncbi:MAG: transcriptional repressor NrdR [Lentisphaeria bacterium]|nr:transcriptional repressor NrdR [Lentisphaeria bacterium]
MRCPKCSAENDKVIDSRAGRDGATVRRRRECLSCGYRFSTLESVVPEDMKVIKRDGRRDEFRRDKLRSGVANACYKRVPPEEIDRIVDAVTSSLMHDFDKEVESSEIGERVMAELRKVDEVAFVRFASVYRKFTAVKDFIHEIKGMKR